MLTAILLWVLFQFPIAWASWALAERWRPASFYEKVAVAFILYALLCVGAAGFLGTLGWARFWPTLALSVGVAAATWFFRPRGVTAALPRLSRPERIAVWLATTFIGYTIYLNLSLPPLGHDSLMYHLFFPARWLQAGGISLVPLSGLPYVAYYPINGELFYLWWMTPVGGDLFAKIAPLVFLGFSFPLWALGAETLGVPRKTAAIGALPCLFMGVVYRNANVADTEIMTGCFLLAGTVFFLRALNDADRRDFFFLSGLAFGAAAGTKILGLVLATTFALTVTVFLFAVRRRAGFRPWLSLIAGCLIFSAPHYLRNLALTGNPLYPVRIGFLGITLFAGPMGPDYAERQNGFTWETLRFFVRNDLETLSPMAFAVVAIGILVAAACLVSPKGRANVSRAWGLGLFLCLAAVAAFVHVEIIPRMSQARQVVPTLMALGPLTPFALSFLEFSFPALLCGTAVAVGLSVAGSAQPEVLALAVAVALAVALADWALGRCRRWARPLAAGTAALALIGLVYRQATLDEALRPKVYEAFFGELGAAWAFMGDPGKIAPDAAVCVTSQRPYPLLGPRYERPVFYAPVNDEGAELLHASSAASATGEDPIAVYSRPGAYEKWLARLRRRQTRYLFVHYEEPERQGVAELRWAAAHPETFKPLFQGRRTLVFELKPSASAALKTRAGALY